MRPIYTRKPAKGAYNSVGGVEGCQRLRPGGNIIGVGAPGAN
jgi:hypothetical protein